tara:strand:+ start:116 stop:1165 length:1050 start_codon:yes stop_codon:yes gene_type:complete
MEYFKEKIATINNNDVYKIKIINNNNYSLEFFNFGGYIHSIRIPYKDSNSETEDILLGYNKFEDYRKDKDYINAIVGRVCGRITNSKFRLNEKTYKLFPNDSPHHIHGGKEGFNKKVWTIINTEKTKDSFFCKLIYRSTHMEEQYPGNLDCIATYSFNNNNEFEIFFEAETDRDTIVNITNHNYWNFHGHKNYYQNIDNHSLKINSDYICEVDRDQIPSGNLIEVTNSKYNFKSLKKIDKDILKDGGIDHCYKIVNNNKLLEIAKVYSNATGMGMIFSTDQPGLQLYTGNMMAMKYSGKFSREYGPQYGICLEAQHFPDGINQPNFHNTILRAGNKYSSRIVMKFKNDF